MHTGYSRRTAIYKGTINDPTEFPEPSRAHGSHHWAFERLLSASLIPMIGAAAATSASPYPILDGVLALSLVVHSHIGVSARGRVRTRDTSGRCWAPFLLLVRCNRAD